MDLVCERQTHTLLCSVMLLEKRFARPRADLHLRPKSNWSCVRRQGHDSRDRLSDGSSKDSSVLQLVSCFCRHRASWSVGTSRQASPCTDRQVSETHGAIPLSGLSLHHRDTCAHSFRCCAHATSYRCLWRPKLHCKTTSGRPVLASCPVAI